MKDKILIVEDDSANGIAALSAMKGLGFDTMLCSNTEDGIEALTREDFLAVLTDLNMPLKKGGSIDEEAGKIVVRECINRCIASAIVTGGIGHRGGTPCIKVLLPVPMFVIGPVKDFSLSNAKEINGDEKSIEAWKQAWIALKDFTDPCILRARQMYKEVLSQPFRAT